MAKIRTTEKINWGGFDPSKLNHVEVEIKEVSKTSESVTFLIKDTVIGENQYIGEIHTAFLVCKSLGEKFIPPLRREAQEASERKENVRWTFLAKEPAGARDKSREGCSGILLRSATE